MINKLQNMTNSLNNSRVRQAFCKRNWAIIMDGEGQARNGVYPS